MTDLVCCPSTHLRTQGVPFFWTTVFTHSIRYTGTASATLSHDAVIIDGDVDAFKFVAYYITSGRVTAVATMGSDPAAAAVLQLMKCVTTGRGREGCICIRIFVGSTTVTVSNPHTRTHICIASAHKGNNM